MKRWSKKKKRVCLRECGYWWLNGYSTWPMTDRLHVQVLPGIGALSSNPCTPHTPQHNQVDGCPVVAQGKLTQI